jgi:hypothetical protein
MQGVKLKTTVAFWYKKITGVLSMSGKKEGKKAGRPRRRATDFDEPGMPTPRSGTANGKNHRGNGTMKEQLTEAFGKYIETERDAIDTLNKGVQGYRSGFEKRVNNRFKPGYKDGAGSNASVRVPSKDGKSESEPISKEKCMTAQATSTIAEEIAAGASTKVDAAQTAYEKGKAEGKNEGKAEATADFAQAARQAAGEAGRQAAHEAREAVGSAWERTKNMVKRNSGKFGMLAGALLTVGGQAAYVAYRARQGDRMTYRQVDGDTIVVGPETVGATPGGNTGGGRGNRG